MWKFFALVFLIVSSTFSGPLAARESLPHMVAVIDEGKTVPEADIAVLRAQAALHRASLVCGGQAESKLADQAVAVMNALRGKGVYARPVDILEGLPAILVEGSSARTCEETLADYGAARMSGMTHSSAVAGLRVLKLNLGTK